MYIIFLAFAISTPICLAVWAYRRKGCFVAVIVFVATVWVFAHLEGIARSADNHLERVVHSVNKWRDDRLAKKAEQSEIKKAQQAEAERVAEAKRKQEEAAAEAERKEQAKADKIQAFALKDAPKVWAVYQSLKSEIDVQNGKIEDLRKTLVAFERSPEEDEDFKRICALRDEMIRSQKALYAKLEDAYIASKKYEASPSRKDYQELHKKALEDGILEADAAEARFKEMRLSK